jgi:hypothetical protein
MIAEDRSEPTTLMCIPTLHRAINITIPGGAMLGTDSSADSLSCFAHTP